MKRPARKCANAVPPGTFHDRPVGWSCLAHLAEGHVVHCGYADIDEQYVSDDIGGCHNYEDGGPFTSTGEVKP